MDIRIATRRSALALWQAEHVADMLRANPDVASVELVPLSTRGDEILDRSLQKIGGKGLFIKELEVAMQSGEADIAVHSMKDVPADMPEGFVIAAVLERANHADALVSNNGGNLDSLPQGATIGSSSLRRQAQLKLMRPDVSIEPLRGNVNTRLAKLERGDFDAIILAAAGLERLGLQKHISQQFLPEQMLPAAAQGVIGIECLESAAELRTILAALNHESTVLTTAAERAIAKTLDASCQSPVATHAVIDGTSLTITALVAMPDGSRVVCDSLAGPATDAKQLGRELAKHLLDQGAGEILKALAESHDDKPLAGIGVLVTRPEDQAADLVAAIEAAGGSAIRFPAIEIRPRSKTDVRGDAEKLGEPDIAIFVSTNAVQYGLDHVGSAKIAVVGPATAAAIDAAGRSVDIRPTEGFDSEHLLAEPALQTVAGEVVRIIRGGSGRELIADTLRERGATVEYLPVYARKAPDVDASGAADIERWWRNGDISVVTAMSVETLKNLVAILPEWCRGRLGQTLLVTPADRVIKEAENLFPGIPTALAKGPNASDMVNAIAEHASGHSK